jgi:hypothetical protein
MMTLELSPATGLTTGTEIDPVTGEWLGGSSETGWDATPGTSSPVAGYDDDDDDDGFFDGDDDDDSEDTFDEFDDFEEETGEDDDDDADDDEDL